MMNKKEKMMKIAHDVFWGKGDTDHPSCPECGSTMNFFGGDDVPLGDAVWKCPDCKFQFSENDLNEYDVFYEFNILFGEENL